MNLKKLSFATCLATTFAFTACEDGGTIEINGPDIDYSFAFDQNIVTNSLNQEQANDWVLIATDTVYGNDLETFLADTANQKYSDMVQAANLKDAKLIINGGSFQGVDSVKISYQLIGSSNTLDLVVGAPDEAANDTVRFSNVRVTKAQVFELIGNNAVIKLSAIYQPSAMQNFLVEGATYQFKAKSTLSVKVLGAAENLFGAN
jgi:hypothetical protein